MRQNKLSKNIFYNVLNQICNFIVPLILSPYVARVLSAELIGKYSYALANSTYFVLLESLGLSLYGTLEIAKKRDNKVAISKLFKEIMSVRIFLMGIASFIYFITFVLASRDSKVINAIMLINIVANGIDTTWFFSGLEEFKLISLRNIVVKIINVILVLILVNGESDLYIYALIMQISILFGYLILFREVYRRVERCRISFKHALCHIPRSMAYFVPGLINTIFSSADKTILGFARNPDFEVGVYEQANKIINLLSGVINSISNVILPRTAYEYNNSNDHSNVNSMALHMIKGAMLVTIPMAFGIAAIADNFVPFFFGTGYEKSAVLLKILCINVIFTVLANYIGQQYLIAKGRQREYNISITVAAIMNVILNFALVFRLRSIGVSLASAFSSVLIFILVMFYCRDAFNYKLLITNTWKYLIAASLMYLLIFNIETGSNTVTLLIKILAGICFYFIVLFLLRDTFFQQIISRIRRTNT